MANNPTKILAYDLDADLGKLIDSLKLFQGTYQSIYDRLTDLGTDTFTDDVKKVIDDLIAGYQDGSILTIQRIKNLKKELDDAVNSLQGQLLTIKMDGGNYNETFTYDPEYENVTREEVTGDIAYTIDYNYLDLKNGILSTSTQKYTNQDKQLVTVTKNYTYDSNGNITNIATSTTVDTSEPTT